MRTRFWMLGVTMMAFLFGLAPTSAWAISEFTVWVEEKPFKVLLAGDSVTLEVFDDPGCAAPDLVYTEVITLDDPNPPPYMTVERPKLGKVKGQLQKPPKAVKLTFVLDVEIDGLNLYARLSNPGMPGTVVMVGRSCAPQGIARFNNRDPMYVYDGGGNNLGLVISAGPELPYVEFYRPQLDARIVIDLLTGDFYTLEEPTNRFLDALCTSPVYFDVEDAGRLGPDYQNGGHRVGQTANHALRVFNSSDPGGGCSGSGATTDSVPTDPVVLDLTLPLALPIYVAP